jgi:hypothetical protein
MHRLSFSHRIDLRILERFFFPTLAAAILFSYGICFAQASPHGNLGALQCTDCHTTQGWADLASPMRFDHSETGFKLFGEHRNTACKDCHANLRFDNTPRDCFSCHQKDYDAAVTIDHRAAGFGTDCTQCHTVDGLSWRSSFNHDLTNFRPAERMKLSPA